MKLTLLKSKDLKPLREKLCAEQNDICPIMKKEFPVEDFVIDHQHMTKSETIGEDGAGLVRGSIFKMANALEGKISNNFKRMGLDKHIDLPTFLRNLADYLEQENLPLVHPNEVPKEPTLMKSSYNTLKRAYDKSSETKKFPEYPKSKKLTKDLKALYEKFGIEPELR